MWLLVPFVFLVATTDNGMKGVGQMRMVTQDTYTMHLPFASVCVFLQQLYLHVISLPEGQDCEQLDISVYKRIRREKDHAQCMTNTHDYAPIPKYTFWYGRLIMLSDI